MWLESRSVQQWGRGFVTADDIARQVDAHEWFLTYLGDQPIAALRYLTSDPDVWPGDEPGSARYIHGLMADRRLAPAGTGADLLTWAENRARGEGIRVMRLDCVETNGALRAFYVRAGYRVVGRRAFAGPWFSSTLLEKRLS